MSTNIQIHYDILREFCHRHDIIKLALFGSVLNDKYQSDSDIDILVEFTPDKQIGMFEFMEIQFELEKIFNRKVDLNTQGFLSGNIKNNVIRSAEIIYAAA